MPLLSVTALSTVKDSEHILNIFHRKVDHKRLSLLRLINLSLLVIIIAILIIFIIMAILII